MRLKKSGGHNVIDLTNKNLFGLSILYRNGSKGKLALWKCKCPCGKIFDAVGADIRKGKIKTCGCRKSIINRRNWQGYNNIPKTYWSSLIKGAEQRNIAVQITIEYIDSIFELQNKQCKLSGLTLSFIDSSASLDRIDSSLGYIEGNVQWIHKTINKMKTTISNKDFIYFCTLIGKHNASQ